MYEEQEVHAMLSQPRETRFGACMAGRQVCSRREAKPRGHQREQVREARCAGSTEPVRVDRQGGTSVLALSAAIREFSRKFAALDGIP